jgi:hypothetical protein
MVQAAVADDVFYALEVVPIKRFVFTSMLFADYRPAVE